MKMKSIAIAAATVRNVTILLLVSQVSGCVTSGVPGMSSFGGMTPPPTTSNTRQKAAFNACQTTGTCNMTDAEAKHSTYRSQLDERKSLADWRTRKRSEDVRRDELNNDALESDVRRRENSNEVGTMSDTVQGYSGILHTLRNFGK